MNEENTKPVDKELQQTAGVLHKIGIGCVTVIGAPFLIFGLVLLSNGLSGNSNTDTYTRFLSLLAGSVLIFGFSALMYKQLKSRKSVEAKLRIKHQYPKEPWKWREDWAKGENWDYTTRRLIKAWLAVAGLVVFALAIPYIKSAAAFGRFFEAYPFLVYVIGASIVVTIFIIARRAFVETTRAKKFGISGFHMSEVPAYLGGRMRGRVETTLPEIPPDGVAVRLENVTFGAGSYKQDENELVKVHCSMDINIPAEELSPGAQGITVPIDFPISKEGLPYRNEKSGSNRMIRDRWRLIVTASLPGVDYRAEFQPPVFELGADGLVTDNFTDIAI